MPASALRIDSTTLRKQRASLALTQTELATAAGIHPVTYCRIETGQQPPTARTVRKIAKALGVEPKDLLNLA